ncbi:uncharacterized protein LOC5498963 isoform X3 [Nematostella vectensis]|nr:uncharacterized protein LOC5498963 isoform X3 [Nematostella vectensis]
MNHPTSTSATSITVRQMTKFLFGESSKTDQLLEGAWVTIARSELMTCPLDHLALPRYALKEAFTGITDVSKISRTALDLVELQPQPITGFPIDCLNVMAMVE